MSEINWAGTEPTPNSLSCPPTEQSQCVTESRRRRMQKRQLYNDKGPACMGEGAWSSGHTALTSCCHSEFVARRGLTEIMRCSTGTHTRNLVFLAKTSHCWWEALAGLLMSSCFSDEEFCSKPPRMDRATWCKQHSTMLSFWQNEHTILQLSVCPLTPPICPLN